MSESELRFLMRRIASLIENSERDADLKTMAEQVRQMAELVLVELRERRERMEVAA